MDSSTHELSLAQRKLFLVRAWRGRCPQCGEGALFLRYARLRGSCEACGLVYRREQGAMTGSMYLSAIATEIFAALIALVIFFATPWSIPVSLAVSVPLVIAFAWLWFPRSMGLWVAIEYTTDVHNQESWARPRA